MKYSKTRDVKSPIRGHSNDAGIDFFVPNENVILKLQPGEQAIIPSGIKVKVPTGYALIAFNKSGIATKKQLLVGAAVVDESYQGEVHINVHNVGTTEQTITSGDKLVQFILLPVNYAMPNEVKIEDLYETKSDRGEGRMGSTGEK